MIQVSYGLTSYSLFKNISQYLTGGMMANPKKVIAVKPARKAISGKAPKKKKKSRFAPAGIVGRGYLKGTTI
jgi:hypothetical protein